MLGHSEFEGKQKAVPPAATNHPSPLVVRSPSYVARTDPSMWTPLPGAFVGHARDHDRATAASAQVLLERMAERLAFERCATRLYEALLARLATGTGESALPRATLQRFHDDAAAHFEILCEGIESLGGDPLAPAAAGDVVAEQTQTLLQAINDTRVCLRCCVDTMLFAELSDRAGWEALLEIASTSGRDALAQRFQIVLQEKAEHVDRISGWAAELARRSLRAAA